MSAVPDLRRTVDTAHAAVQLIDQGYGPALNWDQAIAATEHLWHGKPKRQLQEIAVYLACQVVGLEQSRDKDAALAMHNIASVVRDYHLRQPSSSEPQP